MEKKKKSLKHYQSVQGVVGSGLKEWKIKQQLISLKGILKGTQRLPNSSGHQHQCYTLRVGLKRLKCFLRRQDLNHSIYKNQRSDWGL